MPPYSESSIIMLRHDARAIRDTTTFPLLEFVSEASGYVIALIDPDEGSGMGTVPGAFINGDTGELLAPPGATPVITMGGKWRVIGASLQNDQGGAYAWSDVPVIMKRIRDPEDFYSPFVHGGVIVFRPLGESGTKTFFNGTRLLFKSWTNDFPAAARFASERPAIFAEDAHQISDSQLQTLVAASNRFIAVDAFRRWLTSGRLQLQLGQRYLAASPDLRVKAMLTYLLLGGGDDLLAVIDSVEDTAALKAMCLGAYSAECLSGKPDTADHANRALVALRQKLAGLGVPIEGDPLLAAIFS